MSPPKKESDARMCRCLLRSTLVIVLPYLTARESYGPFIAIAEQAQKTPKGKITAVTGSSKPSSIILDILLSGDLKVDKIEISNFIKGTFYATLYIKGFHCGLKKIDCRPSDAITIAIKYCYPIYVKKRVKIIFKRKNIMNPEILQRWIYIIGGSFLLKR